MEPIEFPGDFSEFLKLLNANDVEYLLVGGFAVAIHGYPRATADMDVWVARGVDNARRIVTALRMGVARLRIELLTSIDGVEFDDCVRLAVFQEVEGSPIPVIGLDDLKANKRASGRTKDLADLDNLP